MARIIVEDLRKRFVVAERRRGMLGALAGVVHRRHRVVEALAFVNFVPGADVLGRPDGLGPEWLAWACPGIGVAFLLVCLQVWRVGERHYRSTGS